MNGNDIIQNIKDAMENMKNAPRYNGPCYPPPYFTGDDLYAWMYKMNISKQRILVSPSQFDGYTEWCRECKEMMAEIKNLLK